MCGSQREKRETAREVGIIRRNMRSYFSPGDSDLACGLREPQVLSAQSLNGAFSFLAKGGLILPGRVRNRPEVLARNPYQDYAASGGRQRPLSKGPGKDPAGGARFGPAVVPRSKPCRSTERPGPPGVPESREAVRVIPSEQRGGWCSRLLKTADNTDR